MGHMCITMYGDCLTVAVTVEVTEAVAVAVAVAVTDRSVSPSAGFTTCAC